MAAGGFVSRALESMLKECTVTKKYPDLQKAIKSYFDNVKEVNQQPTSTSTPSQTNNAASVAGEGSSLESDGGSAFTGMEPDNSDKAQLTTTGTIATALASAGNTIEGAQAEIVLNPLRLAFESKNLKIMEPALDCLHKLIAYDHLEGDPGLEGGKNASLLSDILNMVCSCVDNSSSDSTILQVLKVLLTAVSSTKFRVHGEPLLGVIRICYNIAINSKSPINQATSKAMLTQMISITFRRMETDQVSVSSSSSGQIEETKNKNPKSEETASSDQNEKEVSLGDATNQVKEGALFQQLQNLAGGADIKGLEAALEKAVHIEDEQNIVRGIDLKSMSIGQQNALLVFRTLCKMSMEEKNDEVTQKTRILSLELLQGLLEGVNHSFTNNFHFIDSVKANLSYALLRASVSDSHAIFQYATGIFSVLLLRLRESFKGEIGVFFPIIVLRLLDGTQFPLNQRLSVLRMLERVCRDPQMLVDIYVNYDCDLEAPSLFERMVTTLSKIVQGTQNEDPNSAPTSQAYSTKGLAIQCLVNVLKSLIDWEKAGRESYKQSESCQNPEEEVSERDANDMKREDESRTFEQGKAHKSTKESAISEFNRNPVNGTDYLILNKLVEDTPASVAHFLRNTSSLDRAVLGEYLGLHEEFPHAVMHAYVDSMNFSGMKFDTAIRELLKGFRLPGEAQKIDRIMEKFAERYCADNPELFKNADTAYVLAYAVIMLNTDAHNPMVWPKMSKADFVRMNTMNNAEESAPTELLEEIYDSIVSEEIKMNDDSVDIGKSSRQRPDGEERSRLVNILNLALPRNKPSADTKSESEAIITQTQTIIRNQGTKKGVFYSSQRIELVKPMVEAVGWPLLATFSVTMEEGDNKPRISLCMEGFKAGIHITYILRMDTMRYAFLTSLVRFTFLHAPKEVRSKNAEALRTLLAMCDSEPDSLQDAWNAVLECVSRLEYITSTPSIAATVMYGSNQISRDAVLQSLKELAGKPTEQVFVNSVRLPSDSVVEFFTALCGVSAEELKQYPARVFSLQKLVEISYYNMARIRMVWARLWSVLANHFISAGSHHDEKIAMYAIDFLRQLGMKYLERAELANFTFQNDILKPFVAIMRNSRSESIRRLIVDCIVQMIKSNAGSIKSGWRSVFMIFTTAADDESESIVESAFENVEQVILEHFNQVVGDCFMDSVNCLIRFANNKSSQGISLKAIALLRICEDRHAEGLVPVGAMRPIDVDGDITYDVTEHYWFPMLAGLSDLISDPRTEVRSCALEVLFDLLNERGGKFSTPFWESIFHRVLFPIFDNVRLAGKERLNSSADEWFRETTIHSLQLLCNLFNTFYKDVCFMLPPLLSLLLDCAKKTDQTIVSISIGALVHLTDVGGHQFSNSDWDTLLQSIRDAVYTTQPLELLNALDLKSATITQNSGDIASQNSLDNEDVGPLASETFYADGVTNAPSSSLPEYSSESGVEINLEGSEGRLSPSGRTEKPVDASGFQRSQTIGQRIMGNMMDNLFLRKNSAKASHQVMDASVPPSSPKVLEVSEPNTKEESPLMKTIRGKCVTQILLLGAIDGIQKKYWSKLTPQQKMVMMDIMVSLLEFAALINSYSNLRVRMHHIPPERLPLNLLRQELAGTNIYLDILLKTTSGNVNKNEHVESNGSLENGISSVNCSLSHTGQSDEEKNLEGVAEEKLVSFCEQILREASELQYNLGENTNMEVHRVLELRSPVIVKVLKGMCSMNHHIFERHLKEFYPSITKLICCDQMDVRAALGDLFSIQLKVLLP